MKFLNKKYAKYDTVHESWKNGLFSAVIILLIFLLFQPFGLGDKGLALKLLLFPVYSLLAFFYSTSTFVLIRNILKLEKTWALKNELTSFVLSMFPLTFLVHLFTYWITGDMPFSLFWYLKFLYHVSSLFLTIAVIEFLYYTNKSADLRIENLSLHIKFIAEKLDDLKRESDNEIVSISLEKDSFEISRHKIIFIQSIGNYLEFYLREANGKIKKLIKRGRIHQVEIDLENCLEFFRCHRAFIINLKQVKQIKGNIKNARLVFENNLEEIPVSRSHFKTLKEQLDKIIAT